MMLDVKEAYSIALEDANRSYIDPELRNCIDIGDRFVFAVGVHGRSIKGAPLITVDKGSGAVGFFFLPNEENFETIRKGSKIDISGFAFSPDRRGI